MPNKKRFLPCPCDRCHGSLKDRRTVKSHSSRPIHVSAQTLLDGAVEEVIEYGSYVGPDANAMFMSDQHPSYHESPDTLIPRNSELHIDRLQNVDHDDDDLWARKIQRYLNINHSRLASTMLYCCYEPQSCRIS
jgi:hypothetical protein